MFLDLWPWEGMLLVGWWALFWPMVRVCVCACVCLLSKCVYEVVRMRLHSTSCVLLFMSPNFLSEAALYCISLITEPYLPSLISWAFLTLLYTYSWLLAYLGSKAFFEAFCPSVLLKELQKVSWTLVFFKNTATPVHLILNHCFLSDFNPY